MGAPRLKETYARLHQPNIYLYLNFRNFLADTMAFRKQTLKTFSYSMIAKSVGMSPDLVRLVFIGKRRLIDAHVIAMARVCKLDERQTRYFAALVRWNQAETDEMKKHAWEDMQQTRPNQATKTLTEHQTELLSKWYIMVILEMTNLRGFKADAEWISAKLRKAVRPSEAEHALRVLLEMGLLVHHEGSLKPASQFFESPPKPTTDALLKFHQYMIMMGLNSLSRVSRDQREFGAVSLSFTREAAATARAEVQKFQRRMLKLCAEYGDAEGLYQLNIQLFPIIEFDK